MHSDARLQRQGALMQSSASMRSCSQYIIYLASSCVYVLHTLLEISAFWPIATFTLRVCCSSFILIILLFKFCWEDVRVFICENEAAYLALTKLAEDAEGDSPHSFFLCFSFQCHNDEQRKCSAKHKFNNIVCNLGKNANTLTCFE